MYQHDEFMREALIEAQKAYDIGEVPIGAVVVKQGVIIGRGHNQKETTNNPVAHGEIMAIQEAAKHLGSWRLSECDIYVTLEPCSMCAGAMVLARIKRLYIGTEDPKTGACGSVFNIAESYHLNHQIQISFGLMKQECQDLIKKFFKELRRQT